MKNKILLLSILVIIQTILNLSFFVLIYKLRSYSDSITQCEYKNVLFSEKTREVNNLPSNNKTLEVNANLVWWDQEAGFISIKKNANLLSSVSPFWYELTVDERIEKFPEAEDQEIMNYLKSKNIDVTPIISNEFKPEPLSSILEDEKKKESHIQQILEIVKNYSGISLNYENLDSEDRDRYTVFVKDLSLELYKYDKTLTIHLHAKTEEPGTWNGPQAQDWEKISNYADKLKIMAYDYHWSTSEPGSIAPASWVEQVVEHSLTLIPKEKIFIGTPLYGYDWPLKMNSEATSLVHSDVLKLVNFFDIEAQQDESSGSTFFQYTDLEDNEHEVWYEDSYSLEKKLSIIKKYEVRGIDLWRLGGEDENIWNEIYTFSKVES